MKEAAKLTCSQSEFEGIHAALDKTRRTSETVKVNRQALTHLLMDYSRLLHIRRGEYQEH